MKVFELEIIWKIEICKPKLFYTTYRYDIKEWTYFLYSELWASIFNKFIFDNYNSSDNFKNEISELFNTETYNIILDI
jgi:hypothetical protein